MWKYRTPGIPDEFFQRDDEIPMTKEEVRALTICKARLKPGDSVIDIGCGTGSLTVEASVQVSPGGKVYAIDQEKRAIELTKQNLDNFGLTNIVQLIYDEATTVLEKLPEVEAVFVGAGGTRLAEIINLAHARLKPEGHMVINAILIETTYTAIHEVTRLGLRNVEATQVTVAKGRCTHQGTMMMSRNPITIVSGTK